MNHDSFRAACDALSAKIDAEQFERFRWGRDEVPKLLRLVELVKDAVADRTDVEINEEGGTQTTKRFVIKVHGKRIAGIAVGLEQGRAVMTLGSVERAEAVVSPGEPVSVDYAEVDEAWIGHALGTLFARIQSRAGAATENLQVG